MNTEEAREYFLSKKGTTEGFPFDQTTLVFKVMGKMYGLMNLDGNLRINLKCNPELAIELREHHPNVKPGWHMNKKHWNTIEINEYADKKLIRQWIDHSYDLVVSSLTKKLKEELSNL